MSRSQETFNKKEVRNKKEKKRKDKAARKLERKEREKKGSLNDMMAYVDANGNIVSTPPDPTEKKIVIKAEDIQLGATKREDQEEMDPIRKGNVTFFNESKGFGFIKDSETDESVFVHINNCEEEIKENNMVSFEVEMGQKGPMAVRVKVIR
ncbi:MAG: cold shock domain-containing protein [Bacteroidetes bacterium]|nr:cold shock domain-containing protein [Bacteroidota bacterium]